MLKWIFLGCSIPCLLWTYIYFKTGFLYQGTAVRPPFAEEGKSTFAVAHLEFISRSQMAGTAFRVGGECMLSSLFLREQWAAAECEVFVCGERRDSEICKFGASVGMTGRSYAPPFLRELKEKINPPHTFYAVFLDTVRGRS